MTSATGKLIASNHRQPVLILPTAGIFETVVHWRAVHGHTGCKQPSPAYFAITNGRHFWTVVVLRALHGHTNCKQSSPAHFTITNGGHFWNRRCLNVRCTGRLITRNQHTDGMGSVESEWSKESWPNLSGQAGCLSWEPPSVCRHWHSSWWGGRLTWSPCSPTSPALVGLWSLLESERCPARARHPQPLCWQWQWALVTSHPNRNIEMQIHIPIHI